MTMHNLEPKDLPISGADLFFVTYPAIFTEMWHGDLFMVIFL